MRRIGDRRARPAPTLAADQPRRAQQLGDALTGATGSLRAQRRRTYGAPRVHAALRLDGTELRLQRRDPAARPRVVARAAHLEHAA